MDSRDVLRQTAAFARDSSWRRSHCNNFFPLSLTINDFGNVGTVAMLMTLSIFATCISFSVSTLNAFMPDVQPGFMKRKRKTFTFRM